MFFKLFLLLFIISFDCISGNDSEIQFRTKGGTKGGGGGKPRPPRPSTPQEIEPTSRPEPPRPQPPRPEPPRPESSRPEPPRPEYSRPEPPNNGGLRPPPPPALGGIGDLITNLVNVLINIIQQVLTTLGGILCELLNSVADLVINLANTLGIGGPRNQFVFNLFKQFYSRDSVMDTMGQIAKRLANVLESYLLKRENVGYIGVDSLRQIFA